MCIDCPKRDRCKRPCKEVEKLLQEDNHQKKSNYLVKYVDPMILDAISSVNAFEHKTYPRPRILWMYGKIDKKLDRLNRLQKICICYYYGLRGKPQLSQYKIAVLLHTGRTTVRYHLKKARLVLKSKLLE